MGGDTLIQLSWIGGGIDEIKPIAQRILNETVWIDEKEYVENDNDDYRTNVEVKDFFENIVSGKSYFSGWKGEFWLWGTVGKFVDLDYFLTMTVPFFKELWEKEIILKFRPVVLFYEYDGEHTRTYQIIFNADDNEFKVKGQSLNQVVVFQCGVDSYRVDGALWGT